MIKGWKTIPMAAAVAITAIGVTVAPAAYATTYTAQSCGSNTSGGMCLRYGSDNGWDALKKDNYTLNEWYYPSNGPEIGTHIHSVEIDKENCNVDLFYSTGFRGREFTVRGSSDQDVTKGLPTTGKDPLYDHAYSFEWFCH